MNQIRCPQCSVLNSMSAAECQQCRMPFVNISPDAYVSVPAEEIFKANNPGFTIRMPIDPDNETGRKTFMWYRVYCAVMVLIYLAVMAVGLLIVFVIPQDGTRESRDAYIGGIIYAVISIPFAILFAIALFLPRRPYNWIVGFISMGLGMTSCCFLPALIPLLIFWIKPETQAYFGRKP